MKIINVIFEAISVVFNNLSFFTKYKEISKKKPSFFLHTLCQKVAQLVKLVYFTYYFLVFSTILCNIVTYIITLFQK